jgi:hypothetical protein
MSRGIWESSRGILKPGVAAQQRQMRWTEK